jgi:uncharacterized delta-60 repeat protein
MFASKLSAHRSNGPESTRVVRGHRRPSVKRRRASRPVVEPLEGRALLNAGALDTTFGGTGMVTTNLDSTGDAAWAVAVQPDSKVVVVGKTGANSGASHLGVVRYNPDGSLDTTFGTGGEFLDPFGPNVVEQDPTHQSVAIQGDGKIVVVGGAVVAITTKTGKTTTTTDYFDWLVFRLNPNGTLDSTFGNGGQVITTFGPRARSLPESVAVQPADGKIVVAGGANPSTTGGYGEFAVARYNTDGTADTTFGTGGVVLTDVSKLFGATGYGSSAQSVVIDPAGRILAAGSADVAYSSIDRQEMAMVGYTPGGALDTTFGTGGAVAVMPPGATSGFAQGVGLQSGGQIVMGGVSYDRYGFNNVSRDDWELALARFTPNGALDTTFGAGGSGLYSTLQITYPESLVIQGDDKILAVGYGAYTSPGVFNQNFWVTRVLADGSTADPSFGTNGVAEAAFGVNTVPVSVALDPAGKIVVAGQDGGSLPQFRTARFLGDSTSTATALATAARPSPAAAGAPDPILGALVWNDPTFLDSLASSKHRRST